MLQKMSIYSQRKSDGRWVVPISENPSGSRCEISYLGREVMFLFFPMDNPESVSVEKDYYQFLLIFEEVFGSQKQNCNLLQRKLLLSYICSLKCNSYHSFQYKKMDLFSLAVAFCTEPLAYASVINPF